MGDKRKMGESNQTYMVDEVIEALKKAADIVKEAACTFNACVICSKATESSEPVHLKKGDNLVHLGTVSELNRTDIELEESFAECTASDDKICCITEAYEEYIEGQTWQDVDLTSSQGEGKEKLNMERSYMVCTQYGGIIYFYSHGQELKPLINGERLYYLSEEYRQWIKTAEGMILYPYRNRDDKKEAQENHTVTIGIGITFDKKGSNWEYIKEVLGWSDTEILSVIEKVWADEDLENSEYAITEEQAWELFETAAEGRYMLDVNKAIKAYNSKPGVGVTTYSQSQLEAMFDYAFQTGLSDNSEIIDNKEKVIYYYLRQDQEGAVNAVEKAGTDNRRRLNQMNLFFNEDYGFTDDLDKLRDKLEF